VTAAQDKGLPRRLAQWLTTNLESTDDGLDWRFDLEGVVEMLESYRDTDAWPLAERPRAGLAVHVVVGGRSDRWSPEDLAHLESLDEQGRLHLAKLPRAGHWLHADDPGGLLGLLEGI
jgi:pimeloyl-ACP methyl ester carboxylesterase